jgi:hypothetical protein
MESHTQIDASSELFGSDYCFTGKRKILGEKKDSYCHVILVLVGYQVQICPSGKASIALIFLRCAGNCFTKVFALIEEDITYSESSGDDLACLRIKYSYAVIQASCPYSGRSCNVEKREYRNIYADVNLSFFLAILDSKCQHWAIPFIF